MNGSVLNFAVLVATIGFVVVMFVTLVAMLFSDDKTVVVTGAFCLALLTGWTVHCVHDCTAKVNRLK